MTNDAGQPDEPTSYGLRPPQVPPAQAPVPGQGGYQAQDPYDLYTAQGSYEPTQAVQGGGGPGDGGPGVPGQGSGGHPAAPVTPPVPPHQPGPQGPTVTAGVPPQGGGRVVGDRYQLLSRLGHGGMGTVWRARDRVVEREVAIKEPRLPDQLSEADRNTAYQRMQREARAAARIDHPSVVTMYDVVVEHGKPWVVMELVQGHSLADRLKEGTLDPREAAQIGVAVVGALQAAHEAGVLHRDVKPDNVLLGRGGRVVLTDFGIAQVEGEQGLTETGAFVGSPEFISPERVLGQRPGPAADLWSLGVVLYAAVEGMSPFRRSHTPATLQAVLSAEPQTPARAAGPLAMVIMQLLRKDPMARPSAGEVRQALEAVATPALAPTRIQLPNAAPGNRWVPPVLQASRAARWGLGTGVVVVALALVLLLLDPFGGGGLPKGWEVRPEREIADASLAVPSEYERVPNDGNDGVTFYDPSGVFYIYLEEVDNSKLEPGSGDTIIKPTERAWADWYKAGGHDSTEVKEPKVASRKTSFHGTAAFETLVEFQDYGDSSDDPLRYDYHQLVVPKSADSQVYWRLQVKMPAKGWAHAIGEQLYRDAVAHLEIQGM